MNRMKLWRIRKMSQEAGRQTQICVWAPEHDADLVRGSVNGEAKDKRKVKTPRRLDFLAFSCRQAGAQPLVTSGVIALSLPPARLLSRRARV